MLLEYYLLTNVCILLAIRTLLHVILIHDYVHAHYMLVESFKRDGSDEQYL